MASPRRRLTAAGAVLLGCVCFSPTLASAGVALVQKGTLATGSGASITVTLPAGSTAGDLLVAAIADTNSGCASDTFSAPAGWVKASHACRGGNGPVELWYLANASAGITSVVFNTGSSGANMRGQLSEWSGVATSSVLDQTGTSNTGTTSTTLSVSTSGAIASTGELAITAFETSAGLSSFSPGSGWISVRSDTSGGFDHDYEIGPASGSTLTESITSNPQTSWGGVIATFRAGAGCSSGSLALETSPTVTFPSVTLDAYNATATIGVAFTLDDETGSGAGWNLNATSTTLGATGGKTLPTNATTITAASVSAATGNCSLPTNGIAYPVTLPAAATPPTAATLFDAAAHTGQGPANVTLTASVALPGNAKAGSYSSTWTLALSSGP